MTPHHVPTPPTGRVPRARRIAAAVALGTSLALGTGVAASAAASTPGATAAPVAATPAPPVHQPGGHTLTEDDVDAWLDGAVGAALPATGIPGAAVSVVADGRVLTTAGYGMADTGTGSTRAERVDPDRTLFRVGSVSKTATATAVMQLVEDGEIDLGADVQQYLDFDLDTPKGPVTMRNLLTHTAGFEEVIGGLIGTPGSEESLRAAVVDAPPAQVFTPGTTPAYSNYGGALAGYIAQRVSGEPFESLLQRRVFTPLGMSSSSFAQPLPEALDARLARGYLDDSGPARPTEVVHGAPAGAMSSTVTDMARFMLAQLGDVPTDQALVQPGTLASMHRPALDSDDLGTLAAGQRMDLGFFDESTPGLPASGHDGDTIVFHSAMRLFPDEHAGIFITMNGSGRTATDAIELRDAVVRGFADRYLRGDATTTDSAGGTSRMSTASARAAAADLAGTFVTSRSPATNPGALLALAGQTTVTARADGTVAVTPKPLGTTTAVYEPIGPHLWREVGGDALLATRTAGDDDGTVTTIAWGGAFTMLRAAPWQVASLVLPSLVAAFAVLLVSVVGWPVTALTAIGRGRSRSRDRLLLLSRIGQVSALVALFGWASVAVQALAFQDVGTVTLRVLQVLQLVGVLAVVPAALAAWRAVRTHRGWASVTGRVLVVAALVVVAGIAVAFHLLAPSVTY
ncbi:MULTISPECIES: serine hydrolase [unclassified Curtobacterium]|uniref:serine hydrolase domain-containing protein n=1 Tax=unclassified Curtobacterium TaxID=257496 RepID=UPI0008DE6A39|nr:MULTISPECIES: serine hydrolase domain-containing protein [unclassified Curtobacterium]OIH92998.1 serine hydrolase [Curtobacterium sp. MCBA15_003]OII29911.1 serine hydrolase [Curtobacterium sp. MMLR14_006]